VRIPLLSATALALVVGTSLACRPEAAPGPSPSTAADATSPTPPTPERLRVVYVTRNGAMGPLWVAHEAGLFAAQGIASEMTYISSGTLGMQALLAHEVDIGVIAASSAIAANLGGAETIYIGAIQRTFGLAIYAQPEITTPTDLLGKRVGVTRRNSTTDVGLGYFLDRYGLAADRDVQVIEIGDQAAMVPALRTGAIQAAVLSDPTTFLARREGFTALADLTQMGVEYPQSALTTTRAFAGAHHDLVLRFLRAVYEGVHRYKTDRTLALEVLAEYFQTDDPELLENVYDLYAGRLVQDVPRATKAGARTVLREVTGADPQVQDVEPTRFLDLSFADALDREGLPARLWGR
jgi:NitT/TauT family transport system substrate-binding protein